MADTPPRKLAVLLHADVVGSTSLVRLNETLAHERIKDAFVRLSEIVGSYGGTTHELRGDALVAEFGRASDAVCAAIAFQDANTALNASLEDDLRPRLRVGIAMGEVIVADNTITGEGVVLAQRLEQIAEPGGVCIQGAAYETVPKRLPFAFESLGEQMLKGFDEPVRALEVALKTGESVPPTEFGVLPGEPIREPSDRPSIALLCTGAAGGADAGAGGLPAARGVAIEVLAGVADAVAVPVGLTGVWHGQAVVAGIAQSVTVGVCSTKHGRRTVIRPASPRTGVPVRVKALDVQLLH